MDCIRTTVGYRELLCPGDATFGDILLDDLVGRWTGIVTSTEERDWLVRFAERHLP